MATSKNSSKDKTIRPSMSRAVGPGKYEKVFKVSDATGINLHRNDASAKAFKAAVQTLAEKLSDFSLHSQDEDKALFVRKRAMSVDDLIAEIEGEAAPF